jgi:hypothetical protein
MAGSVNDLAIDEWHISHHVVKQRGMTMTILAAISWGLAVALLIAVVNLCIISTIKGPPRG